MVQCDKVNYQEGDRTFWEQFETEVSEFKSKTAGMEESKVSKKITKIFMVNPTFCQVLSLIRDPTKPLSNTNPLSDDEDL